jgi:hypothetical protein
VEPTPSQRHLYNEIPIHRNILLHMWMGVAKKYVQTPNYGGFCMHRHYSTRYHSTLCKVIWITSWKVGLHVCYRNPSLGLTTKARACKGAAQEGSSKVTCHAPRNVRKCEGMKESVREWTFTFPSELPL